MKLSADICGFAAFHEVFGTATPEHHTTLLEMEGLIEQVAIGAYLRSGTRPGSVLDYDDFCSLARVVALKAIVQHHSNGMSLRNHVITAIKHYLNDELRRLNHSRSQSPPVWVEINVSPQQGYDEDEGDAPIDRFPDQQAVLPSVSGEQQDIFDHLRAALEELPENIRHVLRLYFFEDLSAKEIAAHLEVSDKRIFLVIQKGVAALQESIPYSFRMTI